MDACGFAVLLVRCPLACLIFSLLAACVLGVSLSDPQVVIFGVMPKSDLQVVLFGVFRHAEK